MAGFASWGSAQIQDPVSRPGVQKLCHRHGAGLLYIVQASLMIRMFTRSSRPIIKAFLYPGNLLKAESCLPFHQPGQCMGAFLLPVFPYSVCRLKAVQAQPLDAFLVIAGFKCLVSLSQ